MTEFLRESSQNIIMIHITKMCYVPIKSHLRRRCQDAGRVFVCLPEFRGGFGIFLSVLQVGGSILAGRGAPVLY